MEQELERLERQDIITPVTFSDWAAPIVPVEKWDGSVRVCGDYKLTVNKVAKTEVYPLPRIKEMFTLLAGGKKFSKLDLSHAYQQIEMDESQKYLTVNTHKGLFQYKRLPFVVASAPAVSADHGVTFTRPALCMSAWTIFWCRARMMRSIYGT